MQRRIALKRLTASDLTLFEWQFRNRNAGNQKSINLNAAVFIDELFPSLPDAASELNDRLPLDLNIYGPGHAGLHNLQRKILKGPAYKNWRLDGEYINSPETDPERYNILEPDDLAIFEFRGRIVPSSATLILISQNVDVDRPVYRALLPILGRRSMATISVDQLQLISNALEDREHPFHELTLDAELEDAALGGVKGVVALRRRPGRKVSRDELKHARELAEQVGRSGEESIFRHLDRQKRDGVITDFSWEAEANAVAAYDFLVILNTNVSVAVDVKATNGQFDRSLHVSVAELTEMTQQRRYDLYRVFELTDASAKLRIAENVGDFASEILQTIGRLRPGVQVDSISIAPGILAFGPAVTLSDPPGEESESVG